MCRKSKLFALIAGAFGAGIVLASLCPSWLLVWVLGLSILVIGLLSL